MKIVGCLGAKGGSGRSHASFLLAWEFAKTHKAKVAVLDADVQGTCVSAKALNPEIPFEVVSAADKMQLWEASKRFNDAGVEYLVIDGNPRSPHEDPVLIETIAKLSDLILIVSRPGPRDIKAQMKTVELIKAATKGEVRLLWNFFQKNTGAHREGVPEGERLLNLRSLQTKIGQRIVYQDVGYTETYIGDMGNTEAAEEVKRLGIEVRGLLHGKE